MLYRCYKACPKYKEPCVKEDCAIEKIFPRGNFFPCDPEKEFFCMIVGSRTLSDYQIFEQYLNRMLSYKTDKKIIIVSGDARSCVDRFAERYAAEHDYPLIVFPADGARGDRGGYERNRRMHEYLAKQKDRGVVAFWDGVSRGTQNSFALAEEFHNPIRVCMFKR